MLEQLKTYLLNGNSFCGVEHSLKSNKDILYVTVLKKAKKTLDIENVFESTSVKLLTAILPKNQPVFLIVNNDNVLTKHIESEQSNHEKLVYNAFPNISLDDFYYEIISDNKHHFVSICRKVYLDELLSTYKEKKLHIINISLGNIITSNLAGFVNHKTLSTSNAILSIENSKVRAIEKTKIEDTKRYDINGLQVNNNQVLSLAGALDSVLHHFQSVTNFDFLKQALKNNYTQTRIFTQFSKFGLVFILAILLINFFVFNHYFNKVNTLQQTSQVNQTTKQKLLQLDESVSKSQKMVEDMLKSSYSKSSFYVNAIIQSLPSSILLSQLNYQPLEKKIKKDKTIQLNYNTIILSGESNSSDSFSKWIANLEFFEWISKVEILTYEDNSKSVSNFSLKIKIVYDEQN